MQGNNCNLSTHAYENILKIRMSKWDIAQEIPEISLSLSIPGTLTAFNNLEWCHHAGIMLKKTSCNEEKIRRQQIKKGRSN